jgi:hypothetical protein
MTPVWTASTGARTRQPDKESQERLRERVVIKSRPLAACRLDSENRLVRRLEPDQKGLVPVQAPSAGPVFRNDP